MYEPTCTILAETAAGETIECFRWCRDEAAGLRRAYSEAERTYYLWDQAPDGSQVMLRYDESEMAGIFTPEQRQLLAAGERIIHHWPNRNHNHVILDMEVAAREKMAL